MIGEFELRVRKGKAYAVVLEGWMIVSGVEIASKEFVTIVVGETNRSKKYPHVRKLGFTRMTSSGTAFPGSEWAMAPI